MTVLYGRTDINQYVCMPTGCHHMRVKADLTGPPKPWALDCAKCAPYRLREGWSTDPVEYPRTPAELETERREASRITPAIAELAKAMAEQAARDTAPKTRRAR